jgi:HEPN domain-containing protein
VLLIFILSSLSAWCFVVAYLDASESERWMKSAIRTLKSAEHDVEREDYYFEGEARSAITRARRVVEWVEEVWRESSRGGGR